MCKSYSAERALREILGVSNRIGSCDRPVERAPDVGVGIHADQVRSRSSRSLLGW